MFVGIAAERIEVSIADSEQQESVLRFIQAERAKVRGVSERPEVEVEIRTELAFGRLPAPGCGPCSERASTIWRARMAYRRWRSNEE